MPRSENRSWLRWAAGVLCCLLSITAAWFATRGLLGHAPAAQTSVALPGGSPPGLRFGPAGGTSSATATTATASETPYFRVSPQLFLLGAFAGSSLLTAGFVMGIWLMRQQAAMHQADAADVQRLLQMFRGLLQWTNGVARDVETFRHAVDHVTATANTEAQTPAQPAIENERFLEQLRAANTHLQQRLSQAEAALKDKADEVEAYITEARTDALTGLPNRRVFNEELARRLAEWRRHGKALSVVIVDIDFFKRLNDTYGHPAGDHVLRHVGHVLRETLRETDLAARLGGEEFALILPSSDAIAAGHAAERVRRAIEQAGFSYEQEALQVTVSCGAAQAVFGEDGPNLIKRADRALYAAKEAGRNCSFWHDGDRWLPITLLLTDNREGDFDLSEEVTPPLALSADFATVCHDLRRRLQEVLACETELSAYR